MKAVRIFVALGRGGDHPCGQREADGVKGERSGHAAASSPERCRNSACQMAKATAPSVAASIDRAAAASGKRFPWR